MKDELRKAILAYNREIAEKKSKSDDLDIIISAFAKLPPGQLKKLFTQDVIDVLSRRGINI